MTAPQSVSLDHCYASVATHVEVQNRFFLGVLCKFDIVTPTQMSETSSRSQGGGSVMASNSSSAAARKSQVALAIALQSVNNKEASNANCE